MNHALLVTDVVDSTKLAEQLGAEANGALWAEHDRVARGLLADHGGFELERTDGIGGLFPSVDAALAFASAYHAAAAALSPPLVVRAALHAGDLTVRENPPEHVARGAKRLEVDGVGIAIAARVLSVCGGGATLLTADRPGARSRGHWRLKGVSEPVELFQVGDGAAPTDAAKAWRVVQRDGAWVPARDVPHHLPAERDAFVGRAADLRALADLLDRSRLVSVLGIGGTGKTRLVTRLAWTWLGEYPGGAWFCDLSEARSVEGVCHAVASALDVPLGKDDPVTLLGHAIAGRGECLVVLDNFEQVARHAPDTVGRWLDRAVEARFVVTTREVLGLPGEQALALAPLEPRDAVGLFVARAKQAKADFVADDEASMRALVRLLDGLPLAIELAAARVRVMPPKTLLERMSQRFKLLASTGGRHTRQATLRGALDWSWDLLSPDEQAALAQLSVFEGGFGLEAAERVLALADLWPTDAVQALVDKSLVRQVSEARFDLLVSVQEYAAEKLDARAGGTEAESRHGAWYAAFGTKEALYALCTHGGNQRRRALAADLDNVVAACRRAVTRGDGAVAVATLRAAWSVLELRGPYAVGADLGTAVLGMGLSDERAARAGRVCGAALQNLGRVDEARGHFERALAVARDVGDRRFEFQVLGALAGLHFQQGRSDEALVLCEQSLAFAREAADRDAEGVVLGNLGILLLRQGRLDEARALFEQALALHREVGDRRSEGNVLASLGTVHQWQGRTDEALAVYEQALVVHGEVGNRGGEGDVLQHLGDLHRGQGRMDEAQAALQRALAVLREVGDRASEPHGLGRLASVLYGQGRTDEARALREQALAVCREIGDRTTEGHMLNNLGGLHALQGRMDEARALLDAALLVAREGYDRAFEGHVLGNLGDLHRERGHLDEARAHLRDGERLLRAVNHPHALATLLCSRARLEAQDGDPVAARAVLTEARDLATHADAGPHTDLGQALAKARAAVEAP